MPVIVRLELLGGARQRDQAGLRELLSALPQAVPDAGTWSRIEEWIGGAVGRGQRFGVGDLVIAATAADHDAPIWSLDEDFGRMEKLGFVKRYAAV